MFKNQYICFLFYAVMAKINNGFIYEYDVDPELMDSLIGTVFAGDRKTKNFALNSILKLFNKQNNFQYEFANAVTAEINYTTVGKFFTDTNEDAPAEFTQLIFNKEALRPINLSLLFDKLSLYSNATLKLINPDNENNFFLFKINAITNNVSHFVFDVAIIDDFFLGSFINGKNYNVVFDLASVGTTQQTNNSYFPSGW